MRIRYAYSDHSRTKTWVLKSFSNFCEEKKRHPLYINHSLSEVKFEKKNIMSLIKIIGLYFFRLTRGTPGWNYATFGIYYVLLS